MILVPVKNLANAKQRLSSVLDPQARKELAQAMCADVLETLAGWQGRPAVTVVTSDPFAGNLAARLGFEVLGDDINPGETGAIQMATAFCREQGVGYTLVLPADIPLLQSCELDKILEVAPSRGSVLVSDAAGRGTNAAFRAPADLFPLRFGNDSFLPHQAEAQATGLRCVVLELPGIALDVDRPEDLHALAAERGERRSQRLVRSWSLDAQACRG
jgi:2-phospho-L-lactate guanylyltransferase